MTAIKSHRHIRLFCWLLTFAVVLPLTPLGVVGAYAQPERARTLLLFPVVDEGGSPFPDMTNKATNALQLAISETPGFECTEFSSTSSLVRRAIAEGRVRAVDVDQTKFDSGRALAIGHSLGLDTVVLASIQSYRTTKAPRSVEVILSGQAYDVRANFDAETDEPIAQPVVARAFGVVGKSQPRAGYNGTDRPLMREAVGDAAYKAAQYLAGKTISDVQGKAPEANGGHGASWLVWALAVGLLAVVVGGSGGGHATTTGIPTVTGLTPKPEATGIRLLWNPPNAPGLTVQFYQIERAVDSSGFTQIGLPDATQTSFFDANPVTGSHSYRYRLRVKYTQGPVSDYVTTSPVLLTF